MPATLSLDGDARSTYLVTNLDYEECVTAVREAMTDDKLLRLTRTDTKETLLVRASELRLVSIAEAQSGSRAVGNLRGGPSVTLPTPPGDGAPSVTLDID